MSEAKKCDRCGKYADKSDFGVLAVNRREGGLNWDKYADLCSECYKKVIRWLDDEVEK